MEPPAERNLGEQPIALVLRERGLKGSDLVAASPTPITHKLIARACKGRWLTPHSRRIVLAAINRATGETYRLEQLFNY